jgi:hypothetical protein
VKEEKAAKEDEEALVDSEEVPEEVQEELETEPRKAPQLLRKELRPQPPQRKLLNNFASEQFSS